MAEWVEVAATPDDEEAALIAGLLTAAGIPVQVEGPTASIFPEKVGAVDGLSRVVVPPDRSVEACRLLASREPGKGRAE